MPGAEPKSQHFVHRAYLEGFQDPELEMRGSRSLWVYLPGKSPFTQLPLRVAKRNHYYCIRKGEERDFTVEHVLQELEDAALPILKQLRQGNLDLSPDDRLTFAGYTALSFARVPMFERSINHLTSLLEAKKIEHIATDERASERIAAKMSEESGEYVDPGELRKKLTGGSVVVSQTDRGWTIQQMFQATLELQKLIFGMQWTFLIAPERDAGFLTTDNPVARFDPAKRQGWGIGFASSPAAHFAFPLGRNVCLRAGHLPRPGSSKLNASQVRAVNSAVIARADSQVYAPFKSAHVQKLVDSLGKRLPRKVLLRHGKAVEE